MGNAAVAVQWPGAEELAELYRLDASEPEPDDEDDEDEDEDDDEGGGVQPEEMPHTERRPVRVRSPAFAPALRGLAYGPGLEYTEMCLRLAEPNGARLKSA